MIEFIGVAKRFGRIEALKGVDLSIPKGQFYGLLGPNGAGKSTLMNVLSGIVRADEGVVTVDGAEMHRGGNAVRYRLGLVPQAVAIYPTLNALANLRVFGRVFGLSRRTIRERGEELLQQVGLWERRKDPVKEYSGGMKRRLNIICSLLHEPDYLLCDEPTVGVDPQSRNAIFDFLEAQRQRGLSVVYTTHYMEEAERLCDRIAIIDHGRIIAEGSRTELMRQMESRPVLHLERTPETTAVVEATLEADYVWSDEDAQTYVGALPEGAKLSDLYAVLEARSLPYSVLRLSSPTLEDLFLHLTGRSLRE